jgi:hypothetical protein
MRDSSALEDSALVPTCTSMGAVAPKPMVMFMGVPSGTLEKPFAGSVSRCWQETASIRKERSHMNQQRFIINQM